MRDRCGKPLVNEWVRTSAITRRALSRSLWQDGSVKRRPLEVAAGLVADLAFGEPPVSPHPVSLYGRAMRRFEGVGYRDQRAAGVAHAAIGTTVGAAAGVAARSTALCTYVSVAGRALGAAAGDVSGALETGDLDRARSLLPSLVGRAVEGLDEKEIARAAVESVAENTVDAIVAPASNFSISISTRASVIGRMTFLASDETNCGP